MGDLGRGGVRRGVDPDAAAATLERLGTVWVPPRPRRCGDQPGTAGFPRGESVNDQGVPLVKVTKMLPRILTPEEVDELTGALRTHRDQAADKGPL